MIVRITLTLVAGVLVWWFSIIWTLLALVMTGWISKVSTPHDAEAEMVMNVVPILSAALAALGTWIGVPCLARHLREWDEQSRCPR